jgi:SAM-dependent methyltransferase
VTLRREWDDQAENWLRWARAPGHDSYWQFHGERFLELVPEPGRLTLDIGAGEGRLSRDLRRRGHAVVAIDASHALARACATADEAIASLVADAARLPVRVEAADIAVAFMSLQDIDDLDSSVLELSRVLIPGGRLCVAVVHPINSAGRFEGEQGDPTRPFVIRGSYFEHSHYVDDVERDGLCMRFSSQHRPIEAFSRALEGAGFAIEAIREVTEPDPADKWHRVPLFLHLLATRRWRARGR